MSPKRARFVRVSAAQPARVPLRGAAQQSCDSHTLGVNADRTARACNTGQTRLWAFARPIHAFHQQYSTERWRGSCPRTNRDASAVERLVTRIRNPAARRVWHFPSRGITREQLDGDGGRPSLSTVCAKGLTCAIAPSSLAIDGLTSVRLLTVGLPTVAHVPPDRSCCDREFTEIASPMAPEKAPAHFVDRFANVLVRVPGRPW